MTDDPRTPMLDAAITMHEMFLTLVKAGFTERQALTIISDVLHQHQPEGE